MAASITADALILGCRGAGKTLLVRSATALCEGKTLTELSTASTTGVEIDELAYKRTSLRLREVGSPMIPNWPEFYAGCHCIIFVVDLTNVAQVAEATMELYDMMAHPRTASKPLLLLLNKRDSAVRMSREFVDSSMRLEDLVATATQRITVREISAKTGAGVEAVCDWVAGCKKAAALGDGADSDD